MSVRSEQESSMLVENGSRSDVDVVAILSAEVRSLRRMVAGSMAVASVALVAVVLGSVGFGQSANSAGTQMPIARSNRLETTSLVDVDRVIVPYGFSTCDSAQMPPPMAPVRESGEFYFLSGILGYEKPCVSVKQNVEEQIKAAFYWADDTLKQLGTNWNEVVSVTSYHVNINEHIALFTQEREKYLGDGKYPAWTSVGVKELFFAGEVYEMSLIARKPACIGLECD